MIGDCDIYGISGWRSGVHGWRSGSLLVHQDFSRENGQLSKPLPYTVALLWCTPGSSRYLFWLMDLSYYKNGGGKSMFRPQNHNLTDIADMISAWRATEQPPGGIGVWKRACRTTKRPLWRSAWRRKPRKIRTCAIKRSGLSEIMLWLGIGQYERYLRKEYTLAAGSFL